jgi:hypothetical protein
MILLKFIIQVFERFEIFDSLPHLLYTLHLSADFLEQAKIAYLAHLQIPLSELL